MIKNLDTGEEIPLSLAEEKLPTGINPLTLHIMRRTKEYVRYGARRVGTPCVASVPSCQFLLLPLSMTGGA